METMKKAQFNNLVARTDFSLLQSIFCLSDEIRKDLIQKIETKNNQKKAWLLENSFIYYNCRDNQTITKKGVEND